MKAHFIISGHKRTWKYCWPNILWNVVRPVEAKGLTPFFHFSMEKGEDAESMARDVISAGFQARWQEVEQPKGEEYWNELYPNAKQAMIHAAFRPSVSHAAMLNQLWHLRRSWGFSYDRIAEDDMVIRIRPDSFFHARLELPETTRPTTFVPWWGNFGGINDRFAVFNQKWLAPHYFTILDAVGNLLDLGCPMHSESINAQAVINPVQCNAFFSTIRTDGTQRWPEVLPGEYASDK